MYLKNWREYKLKDIIILASGKTKPNDFESLPSSNKSIPILGGNGILGYTSKGNLDGERIVIGRVGEYCGITQYTNFECWVTDNALYTKKICNNSDVKFLTYLLQQINLSKLRNKSSQPLISQAPIYSLKVLLPPLKEQEKIAEILSNCDRAIELTQKLIASKQKLKRGLMQKLLTGKVRFPEFKEQSFWKKCYLGDLGVCCSGGTPSVNIGEYWNGDIPWCTPTEITALNTPYISSTRRHISKLGLRNSSAELLPKNSVIVCTRATIGYSAINLVPMATNQGFKSIIPNENTDTVFLYYLINSIPRELTRRSAGSTFPEISRTLFKKIPVYIPSLLEEQEKIASLIYKVDLEIEKIQKQRALLQQTKKGLMQQLLTGKTRVPLNQ
jgi:type I restriction enzyme S subunit